MQAPLHEMGSKRPLHEQLPLADIRVVDFGQFIAGPLTARLLGDAGALCTCSLNSGALHLGAISP